MNKHALFEKAIEITKEYARGGGSARPDDILKFVFEQLKTINEEVKNSNED